MVITLVLKFTLMHMNSLLANVPLSNDLQIHKMPEDKVLQINVGTTEFANHVGIDWLIALLAIAGSILALVATDKIVHKLKNKHTKIDWRNEYK
jgi:hypothetical protein